LGLLRCPFDQRVVVEIEYLYARVLAFGQSTHEFTMLVKAWVFRGETDPLWPP